MKKSVLKLMLFAFVFSLLPGFSRASDIKEADYPVQYEVMPAGKDGKAAADKKCTMTLQDKTKPDVAINVWKKGVGACRILDEGKVYRGRQNDKKNAIEIVIPVGETKARIETWEIIGIVDLKPRTERPSS